MSLEDHVFLYHCPWKVFYRDNNKQFSVFFSFPGNSRHICVTERIEMGPMTLRDYINTLEPYDPEKHGWRGEEPWRYRIRYKEPPVQSVDVISEFKNNCHQLNSYQHTNHVVFHETPV